MKHLITGLGNIGDAYANTRHNIGFVVADALVSSLKGTFETVRHGDLAGCRLKGRTILVLKPSTYMNLSGKAIRYWMRKEKIEPGHLLVVVDDLALPLGSLRLRARGSDGGHNGLISIDEYLGTNQYARQRIGIGNDFARGYQVDYVLGRWTREEEKVMIPCVENAVDQIKSFVLEGVDVAMNRYNQ